MIPVSGFRTVAPSWGVGVAPGTRRNVNRVEGSFIVIDELKLDVEHAEAIVEKGIEFEVYTDSMPDSDGDKVEAAHEIVSFAIDAWVNDEVRPDSDNEKVAQAGAQIQEIFEYAGITAQKNGKIKFGPLPEFEGDGEEEEEEVDGEAVAFDVDDIIEDYSEMNGKQRLAAVEEVMGDEGEGLYEEQVAQLLEYEQEQEKPNAKLVEFLEGVINEEEDGEEEAEEEEEEEAEEPEAEGDGEEEEGGEPFEGYDEAKIAEIKAALTEAAQDEDEPLEASQVQYVIDYEKENKNRGTFLKWLGELLSEIENAGGEEEPEEPATEPTKTPKGTKRATSTRKTADNNGSGTVTLTRDEILTALSEGEVTVTLA